MAESTAPALELTSMEQRLLGSLLEKQRTVPSSYPLTFNALRTASNQTSSRDPLVDYSEQDIETCVRELRHRDLVRIIHTPGQRVLKCHQLLDERLELGDDERALITVLLLRGPQSPGELKTRTERLHPFADRTQVEAVLARMAERATPLVRQLPKQPGHHDLRWLHLLGPLESAAVQLVDEAVDREVVLADGTAARDARVLAAYQAMAEHDHGAESLPAFDEWLLTRVAELAGRSPVVDVGCGPGRVTAYLDAAGAEVTGLDVAPAMVERARRAHPDLRFDVGDLRALMRPPAAPAWGVVAAWNCLNHFAPSELPGVIAGLARVLAPAGLLALAVDLGDQVRHVEEFDGHAITLDVVEHDRSDVLAAVASAGFSVTQWYVRGPDAQEVDPSERLYLLATRST